MATDETIDAVDLRILTILQENARTSNAEIARQVSLAPSAVFERVKKLEEKGLLKDYPSRLDPKALGYGLLAFVFVRSDDKAGLETAQRLTKIPEVQEVHHVAGEDCYLVKVRTFDTESLGRLLREKMSTIKGVRTTRTTIVLETLKETTALPLPEPGAERPARGAK